jgi:hypothetical protein
MNCKRIPATGTTMKRIIIGMCLLMLTACQPATQLPAITAQEGEEFTLAVGQSAQISGTDLTLTLIGVPSDGRCPLDIECAESGPVTVVVTVRSSLSEPIEIIFQAFTDNDGRVPEMEFQGVKDREKFEWVLIQVESILPFPQMSVSEIGDGEYRVSFLITK